LNNATEYQTYKVEKGDNLWKISKRFYGSGKLWKRIYEANSDIIANPDKIKTGMQLKIPAAQ
jgi:nucleoid-associated protein YgaU